MGYALAVYLGRAESPLVRRPAGLPNEQSEPLGSSCVDTVAETPEPPDTESVTPPSLLETVDQPQADQQISIDPLPGAISQVPDKIKDLEESLTETPEETPDSLVPTTEQQETAEEKELPSTFSDEEPPIPLDPSPEQTALVDKVATTKAEPEATLAESKTITKGSVIESSADEAEEPQVKSAAAVTSEVGLDEDTNSAPADEDDILKGLEWLVNSCDKRIRRKHLNQNPLMQRLLWHQKMASLLSPARKRWLGSRPFENNCRRCKNISPMLGPKWKSRLLKPQSAWLKPTNYLSSLVVYQCQRGTRR